MLRPAQFQSGTYELAMIRGGAWQICKRVNISEAHRACLISNGCYGSLKVGLSCQQQRYENAPLNFMGRRGHPPYPVAHGAAVTMQENSMCTVAPTGNAGIVSPAPCKPEMVGDAGH